MSDALNSALDLSHLAHVARQTARRLASLVRDDGGFIYRYDAATMTATAGYNILRHAGCIWMLNAAAAAARDDSLAEAAARAAGWLVRRHVRAFAPGQRCVVEDGEVKLGGNALAVLALTTRSAPPPDLAPVVRELCAYIQAQMCHARGDYIHKRSFESRQVQPFWSAYYTGEALFALLSASLRLDDPALFDAAMATLLALVSRGYGIAEQSHWMMYAVATAYSVRPEQNLVAFADALTLGILRSPSYRQRDLCTPIACRTEALLTYLLVFGDRAPAAPARDAALANLSLQMRDYRPDGAFVKGGGSEEVRIDYLQHNLATLLLYKRCAEQETAPTGQTTGQEFLDFANIALPS